MEKFTLIRAIAAPMPRANIDTDMIIPQKFLKTITRSGLGKHAFTNIRYYEDGSERKDFILNQPPYNKAHILLAGENFGCGSSREHAAWALKDFGITCIIAPSFADIFLSNCFKNAILPITLSHDTVQNFIDEAQQNLNSLFTVDLEKQEITGPNNDVVRFDIDPFRQHCLLQGLDEIDLTLEKESCLTAFETNQAIIQPWLYG